jgi:hypothetical protein
MQMERWVQILWIAAIAVGVIAIALFWPVMRAPRPVVLGNCLDCAELLRTVPAAAAEVYVVPSGGAFFFALRSHPIREESLLEQIPSAPLLALAIGDAPVVAWHHDDRLSFAVKLSAIRRALVALIPVGQAVEVRDGVVFIGPRGEPALGPPPELVLADGPAHAFAIHRHRSPVPGLHSPSLTAITLGNASLSIVSRAPAPAARAPLGDGSPLHPRGAMFSFVSGTLPEAVSRFDRVLPFDPRGLGGRGMLVLYGAEGGRIAPRIRGVLVMPASQGETAASLIERLLPAVNGASTSGRPVGGVTVARREAMGLTVEAAIRGGDAILAFDGKSMETYLGERDGDAPDRQAIWSLRLQPQIAYSMLKGVRDSLGFRLLGADTRDSIRRLQRAVGLVRDAKSLSMELVPKGELDEVRMNVEW